MFLNAASGVAGLGGGLGTWLPNTGPDAGQGSFFNRTLSSTVIRDPEACHREECQTALVFPEPEGRD